MRPYEQRTSREEIDELLVRTSSSDAAERAEALRSLCPCHVKRNEPRVWDRILLMANDASPKVRSHAFHLLADGSPREREPDVVAAIQRLQQDPDEKLRRRARRKLMARYRRGGRINAACSTGILPVSAKSHGQDARATGDLKNLRTRQKRVNQK